MSFSTPRLTNLTTLVVIGVYFIVQLIDAVVSQTVITNHPCFNLTSPIVGGVYHTSDALTINWTHNEDALAAFEDNVNANATLSLKWIDNFSNQTGTIAVNLDRMSGTFLWNMSNTIWFNKRLYVTAQMTLLGLNSEDQQNYTANPSAFERNNGLECSNTVIWTGPFTVAKQQQLPYFFVTSPDPGRWQNTDMFGPNQHTYAQALAPAVGMIQAGKPLSVTWYCAMSGIDVVDLYLVSDVQDTTNASVLITANINIDSTSYTFTVPSNNTMIPIGSRFWIMLYGYKSGQSKSDFVSWACDGAYTLVA